jgi:hypothetical protein
VYSLNNSGSILSEFAGTGAGLSESSAGAGGLNAPIGLAVDGTNQVWVANGDGSVSTFNGPATPIYGPAPSGQASGRGVAVDLSGNVWVVGSSTVTEFLGAGAPTQVLSQAVEAGTPGTRP